MQDTRSFSAVVMLVTLCATFAASKVMSAETIDQPKEIKVLVENLAPIQDQPLPESPMPVKKPAIGLTLGSRYEFDADDHTKNEMRLFVEQKLAHNQSIKLSWERQVGETVNFFRNSVVDGVDYNNTGRFFVEYSKSF